MSVSLVKIQTQVHGTIYEESDTYQIALALLCPFM